MSPKISALNFCEFTDMVVSDARCQSIARWEVGVGERKTDRQRSCGRHLNRTCEVFVGSELPRQPTLTIRHLGGLSNG